MKKNGFTTVELISTFALTSVIVLLLFELVLSLKQVYINAGVKSVLLNKQVIMTEKIYNDFNTKKIIIANACGNNCITFIFNDYSKSTLKIDKDKKLFTYGNYTMKLDGSSNFGDIKVENSTINGISDGKNNSLIKIQIPITSNIIDGEYGINLLYQYDSRTTSIDNIKFNNSDIDNKVYLKGGNKVYVTPNTFYEEAGYYTVIGDTVIDDDLRVVVSGIDEIDTTILDTYEVTYNFYIDGKLIDTAIRKVIVGYPPILTGATYVAPSATDTHKGIVYFDPTNLSKKCTAENSVSTTETKEGCMKWYIYDNSRGTYKLILDHNTTARVAYNSNNVNTSMLEVDQALKEDILNWDISIKDTASLIKADEIATITGNTSFNSATTQTDGWFYFDSNNQTQSANSTNKSKYAWLYDNINGCINYGCNINDQNKYTAYGKTTTDYTYGYWIRDAVYNSSTYAWHVYNDGTLVNSDANYENLGVRPVITISKTDIEIEEEIQVSNATYVAPLSTDTHKGIIYLDPTDLNKVCNVDNSVSTTETKEGCMKWYIYDNSGGTYKLILDHNTTARVAYNSNNVNTIMLEVDQALKEDILNWDISIKDTARLIQAQDIANITGNTSFNSSTTQTDGWFYLDSNNQTQSANSTNKSKYSWLYDNTNNCLTYGCNAKDSNRYTTYGKTTTGISNGYWTSDAVYNSSTNAWNVGYSGDLYSYNANVEVIGVRPVITIPKSIIR